MRPLHLDRSKPEEPFSILCLGAHCDDIEIGCGGSVLRLVKSASVRIHWVVFCSTKERKRSALASAEDFLGESAAKIEVKEFHDSFLPNQWGAVKEAFEALKGEVRPDLIFTHYRGDLHQDHRTVSELTWNTFRDHHILEYEIPKYDGDLGAPNFFIPLDESIVSRKCESILRHFHTEAQRTWFSEETFRSLMKLRGIECNAPGVYAEGFYCRKVVLSV